MKLAIIGSRSFNDYEFLKTKVNEFKNVELIVSGGAEGADTLAERYAKDHGVEITIFKPEWKKNGKGAALMRNKDIVDSSDHIIAFWDFKSTGTKHAINYALKQEKNITVLKI